MSQTTVVEILYKVGEGRERLAPDEREILMQYANGLQKIATEQHVIAAEGCTDTTARAMADANARSIRELRNALSTLEGRVNFNRDGVVQLKVLMRALKDALCTHEPQ